MPCPPKPCVEGDVIIADLELFACGDDADLPPDAVDDQPVTDMLASLCNRLKAESLKVFPNLWVGFVPLPEVPLAFVKRLVHFEPMPLEEPRPS